SESVDLKALKKIIEEKKVYGDVVLGYGENNELPIQGTEFFISVEDLMEAIAEKEAKKNEKA
ncbi:MAG TPA: hypothetical protein VMW25_04825, partial [Clostridia bacterium]|nr:hypothetical protein [Clostridia bacterium]